MNTKTAICLSFSFFILAFALHAQSAYAPDQILIKFNKSADQEYIDGLQSDLGAVDSDYSPLSKVHLWTISDSFPITTETGEILHDLIEILEFTQGKAKVDAVDLNYLAAATPQGNSTIYPPFMLQDYTPITGCGDYPGKLFLDAPSQNALKIAIIDTGIDDQSHPDLFSGKISSSFNFINNTGNASDDNGHGTQVSGIIAGMAYVSALPNVRFLNLKAMDHTGLGHIFDIIEAIDYAMANGANIINCSFGYEPSPDDLFSNLFHSVLQNVSNQNILTLVSAGNRGLNIDQFRYFPAGFSDVENMITVAASTCNGDVAHFTNFGEQSVELAAPGVNILCPTLNGEWVTKSGTSFATPIVTGIAMQMACQSPDFIAEHIYNSIIAQTKFSPPFVDLVSTDGLANITSAGGFTDPWVKTTSKPAHLSTENLAAFPNPFETDFTLSWNNEGPARQVVISLKDLMNRPVWQYNQMIEEGTNLIPVSPGHLPSGYYIIELSDGMKTIRHKVLRTADGGR